MSLINFGEVGLTGRKTFTCSCGKRVRRQRRFYQTINPFNLMPDGRQKNSLDIIREVGAERDAWMKESEPCTHARPTPSSNEKQEKK